METLRRPRIDDELLNEWMDDFEVSGSKINENVVAL